MHSEDIAIHGGGLNSARISSQLTGFPTSVPGHVVIKACGSSLKAITNAALTIKAGQEEVVIAGGVENMSQVPYLVKNRWGTKFGKVEMEDDLLTDGLICSLENEHMGMTAERLTQIYSISREEQDKFAFDIHKKADRAIENHYFDEGILPVQVHGIIVSYFFRTDESV